MLGLDFGNYNIIVAKQTGNETTTLQDSTGLRQLPATIRYDDDYRHFRTRNSKADNYFIHNLEVSKTVEQQMKQVNNINSMINFIIKDYQMTNQVVCSFPSHYSVQTRCVVETILRNNFSFAKLVPHHMSVASQYFFRRFNDFQQRPLKAAFLQINEFDTVYTSFKMYKDQITTLKYQVLSFGSIDFDSLIFQICQRKNSYLINHKMEKYLAEIKKAKISLSLNQAASITFPEFDIRVTFEEFDQLFQQQYQNKILQLIENDIDSIELLGGGARMLNFKLSIPIINFIKQKQTKRLNPDEVCAQGAICFYLLTSTNKLKIVDQYQSQDIYFDGQLIVGKNTIIPCEKKIQYNYLNNKLLKLHLANGFTLNEVQLIKRTQGFGRCNLVVNIDQFNTLNLNLQDVEIKETFTYFKDQNLIDNFTNFEKQQLQKDNDYIQKVMQEEQANKQQEPVQQDEPVQEYQQESQQVQEQQQQQQDNQIYIPPPIQQQNQQDVSITFEEFVYLMNNQVFDKFMNVQEMKTIQNILNTPDKNKQSQDFNNNHTIKEIMLRKDYYDNYLRHYLQYENHAKQLLSQQQTKLSTNNFANLSVIINNHLVQTKQQLQNYINSNTGHLVIKDILQLQNLQYFIKDGVK